MTTLSKSRLTWLISLVGCLSSVGCSSEYDLIPLDDPPDLCAGACQPRRMSSWINDSGESEMAGFAVEVAAWGYEEPEAQSYEGSQFSSISLAGYTVNTKRRTAVFGAPYAETIRVPRGRIYMLRAGVHDGELGNVDPRIVDGPFSRTLEFGYALLAADIRNGRVVGTGISEGRIPPTGFGEEVIVGAPGTNDDTGEIYWYENQGAFTRPWEYGDSYVPSTAVGGDRFGSAIAAPHNHDASHPNDVDTTVPDWIAVGAPGGSKVYILGVDPSRAQPFSFRQTITGPAGSLFGTALSIADFNLDGVDDLAVGAPADSGGGRIYIYSGHTGVSPFRVHERLIVSESYSGGELGHALAAGFVNRSDLNRPLLVAGAPGASYGGGANAGAICQYQFQGGSPMTLRFERCDFDSAPLAGSRYGHAVAVGNFIATNSGGQTFDSCAQSEEVAVGAPTATRLQNGLPTDVGAGFTKILAQGAEGAEPSEPPINVFWGSGSVHYSGYALAAEYVQRNEHQDLLIGSPYRDGYQGSVSLTRAELPGSEDDDISGVWRGQDSDGDNVEIRVRWTGAELELELLNNATIRATRTGGNCRVLFTDVDFTGIIPIDPVPWPTVGVDHEEHVTLDISDEVGVSASIEADLSYDASSHTFTMNIDENAGIISGMHNDCRIQNFVFTQTMTLACD